MTAKHSKKTMDTITELNTTPEQWGIAPFTVRAERRDMNLRVKCKSCNGSGCTYDLYAPRTYLSDPDNIRSYYPNRIYEDDATVTIDEMFEASGQPDPVKYDGSEYPADEISYARWQEVKNRNRLLPREMGYFPLKAWPCKTCANGRHQYNRSIGVYANNSTGFVYEWTENVAVNAHYPAWPVGTDFSSRYDGHDCEACGKNHIKSGTYPVVAQRADGTHTGLFVGNTCVAKFGFKKFTPVDKQAERHAEKRTEVVLDIYYRSKGERADDLQSEE